MSFYEYHVAKRYIQYEYALSELPKYLSLIGRIVLFLEMCDPVREAIEAKIRAAIRAPSAETVNERMAAESSRYRRYADMSEHFDALRRGMTFEFMDLGEAVVEEAGIRRTAEYVRRNGFDTVVGIGGGKALDYARAVTHFVDVKIVLVPTLCATNASVSTLSVIYSSDGQKLQAYWRMDSAPELVLVDTEVLIETGPRVLAMGIGDIFSTYCEAMCNQWITGRYNLSPQFANEAVELSADLLIRQAPEAMEAMRRRRITPAFESVVSMIMHNCGPLNMICTTGYAHILDELFLAFDAAHAVPHGLRVGYAALAMLRMSGYDDAHVLKAARFCNSVGIPVTLTALGLGGKPFAEWANAFDVTLGASQNHKGLPFPVTKDEMIRGLLEADRFLNDSISQMKWGESK